MGCNKVTILHVGIPWHGVKVKG